MESIVNGKIVSFELSSISSISFLLFFLHLQKLFFERVQDRISFSFIHN